MRKIIDEIVITLFAVIVILLMYVIPQKFWLGDK